MSQYHELVNLDKKEYVHAHRIGNGLKLLEQVGFAKSTSTALWFMLACSNGRGEGDARNKSSIDGLDALAIYEDLDNYTDISYQVRMMLIDEFGYDDD